MGPCRTSARAGDCHDYGLVSARVWPLTGTYRARLSGPDTAGGLRLIHEVAFTLGIMVERLGGIETRHRELGEWIDRWMDM